MTAALVGPEQGFKRHMRLECRHAPVHTVAQVCEATNLSCEARLCCDAGYVKPYVIFYDHPIWHLSLIGASAT